MRNYLLIALFVAVVAVAGCQVPPEPQEEPPAAPAPIVQEPVEEVVVEESPMPVDTTLECEMDCSKQCDTDSDTACALALDYNACVEDCGDIIRSAGCKGACASGVPIECGIIFRNECAEECMNNCA